MTLNQIYRELAQIMSIRIDDDSTLVNATRIRQVHLRMLQSRLIALSEKIDYSRTTHDFRRSYLSRGQRPRHRPSVILESMRRIREGVLESIRPEQPSSPRRTPRNSVYHDEATASELELQHRGEAISQRLGAEMISPYSYAPMPSSSSDSVNIDMYNGNILFQPTPPWENEVERTSPPEAGQTPPPTEAPI